MCSTKHCVAGYSILILKRFSDFAVNIWTLTFVGFLTGVPAGKGLKNTRYSYRPKIFEARPGIRFRVFNNTFRSGRTFTKVSDLSI